MVMLWLLSKAQQKHPKMRLVGLCAYAGMRIEKMLDQIHNRGVRKQQKLQLKKLAMTGQLRTMVQAILNPQVMTSDTDGFFESRRALQHP